MPKENELIKSLRQERHLSQEFLANGLTTREAVSRFEKRGTHLSSETLLSFLAKMNVTLEEYIFSLNDHHLSFKESINREGSRYYGSPNERDSYLEGLAALYNKSNDQYYLLIRSQFILLYDWYDGNRKSNATEIKQVRDYLNHIENWGRFELSLFSNLLFVFDSEYIWQIFITTIHTMLTYGNHEYYKRDINAFLTNLAILFWRRSNYDLLQQILPYLKKQTLSNTDLKGRITYIILTKALLKKDEFCMADFSEEIKILNFLGYEKLAVNLSRQFTK